MTAETDERLRSGLPATFEGRIRSSQVFRIGPNAEVQRDGAFMKRSEADRGGRCGSQSNSGKPRCLDMGRLLRLGDFETMSRYHRSADDVPEKLSIPHWSWDGLQG